MNREGVPVPGQYHVTTAVRRSIGFRAQSLDANILGHSDWIYAHEVLFGSHSYGLYVYQFIGGLGIWAGIYLR